MTLLAVAQGLAKNVGLAIPDSVIGSTERTWREVAELANAAGEELARRVDWGQLTDIATLTGDGTNKEHAMPVAFSRITRGAAVIGSGGTVRPVSQAEWRTFTPVEGVPRYFILRNTTVILWPYLADTETVSVSYQSKFWCDNGTAAFAADDDASLIDETLLLKGLEVRWRRQRGMDYGDQEAEYEAALQDYAVFNDRSRL